MKNVQNILMTKIIQQWPIHFLNERSKRFKQVSVKPRWGEMKAMFLSALAVVETQLMKLCRVHGLTDQEGGSFKKSQKSLSPKNTTPMLATRKVETFSCSDLKSQLLTPNELRERFIWSFVTKHSKSANVSNPKGSWEPEHMSTHILELMVCVLRVARSLFRITHLRKNTNYIKQIGAGTEKNIIIAMPYSKNYIW